MNLNKKIIATFKKTLIFTLILMWAFLPMGDYLFLKIGDWKIALAPKSKIAKAQILTEDFITAGSNSWSVPEGVNLVTIHAWGAGGGGGGGGANDGGGTGGGGGYTSDTISVNSGETLTIIVGSAGN